MASAVTTRTAGSTCSCTTWWAYSVRPYLALEPSAGGRQGIPWYILVHMDRLCVLAQVIKSREASRAVALKGSLAGVLSDMAG